MDYKTSKNPYKYALAYLWVVEKILSSKEINLSSNEKEKLLDSLKMKETLATRVESFKGEKEDDDPLYRRSEDIMDIVLHKKKDQSMTEVLLQEICQSILEQNIPPYLIFYETKWIKYLSVAKICFIDDQTDRTRYQDMVKAFNPEIEPIPSEDELLESFEKSFQGIYYTEEWPFVVDAHLRKEISYTYRGDIYTMKYPLSTEDVFKMRKTVDQFEVINTKGKNSIGVILKNLFKKIYKGGKEE